MSKFTQSWDGPTGKDFVLAVHNEITRCLAKIDDRTIQGYGDHHQLPFAYIHGPSDLVYILEEKINREVGADGQILEDHTGYKAWNALSDGMIEEAEDIVVYAAFLLVILRHLRSRRKKIEAVEKEYVIKRGPAVDHLS